MVAHAEEDKSGKKFTHCQWEEKLAHPLQKKMYSIGSPPVENGLLQDPAISFLGIYPKDSTFCDRDPSSYMFIAILFIIVRNWKQLTYSLSPNKWVMKMQHNYTIEYYSFVKKTEIMNFSGK